MDAEQAIMLIADLYDFDRFDGEWAAWERIFGALTLEMEETELEWVNAAAATLPSLARFMQRMDEDS